MENKDCQYNICICYDCDLTHAVKKGEKDFKCVSCGRKQKARQEEIEVDPSLFEKFGVHKPEENEVPF